MTRTQPQYRLYLWKRTATGQERGKLVGSFSRYKDLVAEAQRKAVAAGCPKSRWMDRFDWSL
jgi:hypothetical protein